jgi:hypothetical protein
MGHLPGGIGLGEKRTAGRGEAEAAAAPVLGVDLGFYETAALQRFERRGQRRAIHGEERGDLAHYRRVLPVQGDHQRELTIGKAQRPEDLVEMPCQRPCRPLHGKAQAGIADLMRLRERQGATG